MNNSVAFSIFTVFCNHHLYLVQNIFITPKGELIPFKQPFCIRLPPALDIHQYYFLSLIIYLFWILRRKYTYTYIQLCPSLAYYPPSFIIFRFKPKLTTIPSSSGPFPLLWSNFLLVFYSLFKSTGPHSLLLLKWCICYD